MSIIKNISNEKPFEVIPRELLQSCDKKRKDTNNKALSLEAIGLLCNLQSYPEGWELHKTELYNRYEKNGKSKVMRIWDELVEAGYIIQFKIRSGNNYEYHYYFSVYGITEEQIKEKEEYHQAKVQNKFNLDFRKSEVQKSAQNQDILDFSNSEVQNGKSSLGSPKPEANIIHNQYNTHKDITHEDNTHYNTKTSSSSNTQKLIKKLENEFKIKVTKSYQKELETVFKSFTDDIIEYAIEYSSNNADYPKKYIKSILEAWKNEGIKTLEEAQNYKIQSKKTVKDSNNNREMTPKWLIDKDVTKNEDTLTENDSKYYNEVINKVLELIYDKFENAINEYEQLENDIKMICNIDFYELEVAERKMVFENTEKFINKKFETVKDVVKLRKQLVKNWG
ncbi:DnaD domain protein [Staphylococcus shinii]|uniref:DnaD domain-containing protein n=1 Tax=Staphylococcus shinii TaxID=2912228 RepID=UPI003F545469